MSPGDVGMPFVDCFEIIKLLKAIITFKNLF